MNTTRRGAMGLMAAAAVASVAGRANATDQTILKVDLWDTGAEAMGEFDTTMPIMLGMPGVGLKDSAPMGVRPEMYTVPAGEVQFDVTNTSEELEHEMLVLPISDLTKPLPYNNDSQRLDEDAAGALGEVAETEPGANGSLTLHLKPGLYMLACNIEAHYAMGMWTIIRVT